MIHGAADDFSMRLAAAQPTLSPKMARLARFLSERYVEAAFMSTRKIAAAAGVSLATVVRFPRALGYDDFEALRSSIRDRVNFDLTGVERLRTLPSANRSPSALLRRIIDADIEALSGLAHTFSEPLLERFVGAILTADRVTVLGFRYVSPLAAYFGYSLAKVKPGVRAFTEADSSLYDWVRLMDAGDVLVVLAFPRYPSELVALARYARDLGVRVVAITDSPLSPILPQADIALFAKVSVLDFVGSLAAPAALINCIVSEVGVRLGRRALERLEALEEAATAADIYVRAGGQSVPVRGRLPARRDGDRPAADAARRGVSG